MSWLTNLSISISTIVIFFYLTILLANKLIDGSTGREWEKEKYIYWFGFVCWIIFNIWQWVVFRL